MAPPEKKQTTLNHFFMAKQPSLRWWPRNATSSAHLDTPRTAHRLSGLQPDLVYRVAVTAANRDGTSLETITEFGGHTPPSDAAATALIESGDGGGGTALVAALVVSALVAALVLAVVWLVRRRRMLRGGGPHVSFANPTYLREATPQEPAAITVTGKSDGDGGASVGRLHSSASDGWHEAALETPAAVRP